MPETVAPPIVRLTPFEVAPDPFCTETVYVPAVFSVTGPISSVAFLVLNTPFGTVQVARARRTPVVTTG